ncbi:group 1 glycosyl transferase [Haloterrigena salina JCM 13891]|uniref:Group 1 glycosyl transferase n=1 Tax=Haloterrigena salina JCM 13891 TaxID=1227488 RepID=M0C7E5_9EURY|nr:glycosyltransferase [Haloterrigena salina]ELZ19145.1 group 1 glycosyl transferase [Haloterrigena salina JCM 13891]
MVSETDPQYGLADDLRHLKIAVVTDPIWSKNGGIDVIANITKFLDAPLYTLRQTESPKPLEDVDVRSFGSRESWLQRQIRRRGLNRLFYLHQMLAYQDWNPPREFDVIVTTGPLSQQVIQHPEQARIHFFNSPARWLWDLTHDLWNDRFGPIRWFMRAFANHIRNTDVSSIRRFDRIVGNSDLVAGRIDAYYGEDATVAYCPVDTYQYRAEESEDYYVMVNRLVPEKRVKLVIEAFNDLGLPLKIAGDTRPTTQDYAEACRELANDNIEFLGWVEGEGKVDLLAQSRGLIFAGKHEDFGMPPVEAMASGKPVVGVDEGFTKYQVDPGETGVLFKPDVSDLVAAVERTTDAEWDEAQIQAAARTYDVRNTRVTWQEVLRELDTKQPK